MKIFLIILISIVVFGLIGYWSFTQTLTPMQTCIDNATIKLQQDISWVITSQRTQEQLCQHSYTQYQELSQCYRTGTRYLYFLTPIVESIMVRRLPNFPNLVSNRAFHNRVCQAYPTLRL